ncbi:S8 family serine peptidase [Nocardioides acrostichi]|uniref:S8 family serine peptidase n=1 Tax=Nocardioides acrostichi TaxID=2784339 RepID=A0A930UZ93_9ACTN|nr:S8 family serine peptidase [Nocardioides acrostichi]MBF4161129.1 S8 family serine peptidase [Nocardioides acrostichi]
MSKSTPRRRHIRALGLLTASALTVGLAGLVPANAAEGGDGLQPLKTAASKPSFKAGNYIVLLSGKSASEYTGGVNGLAATKPAEGRAFLGNSKAVAAYSSYLAKQQTSVAKQAGAKIQRSYTIASNGFSASLSGEQAANLSTTRGVAAVVPVEQRTPDYKADAENTANFLGMYSKHGAWSKDGGQANAGSGVVVGDIDSGIWPDSDSFAGDPLSAKPSGRWGATMDPLGDTHMDKSDGGQFNGTCETGEEFTLDDCSTKIIGARYYDDSFVAGVPPEHRADTEYLSPRDGGGHGSHTASTAAGNVVKDVSVDGIDFGEVTGMVPGASLAIYKVCWEDDDEDTGGCYTDAILDAIDDAVRDGVDVLNFSISGALATVIDPVEIAFAGAAQAGVFVSASAGNSGPTASTVAHNSPWLTTVAASTWKNFDGTVEFGDGQKFLGAMIDGTGVPEQTPVVDSVDLSAGDDADAQICGPDSLTDDSATGKIVLCLRGTYARTDKSAEVKRVGGVGMIMVNPSENSLDADLHSVPTVHLQSTDADAVYDYVDNTDDPTAALLPGNQTDKPSAPLPQVSGFSSRGPALANDSDLLKPDIAAPGQTVLAAVAPPSNHDRDYDLYSGTSMAAPHITGLGALLLSVHPDWTPQMVQSAMMTTAKPTKNDDGSDSTDAFAQGAGEVSPRGPMFNPGAFVTSTARQWYGLMTDQGYDTGQPAVDPRKVNIPSMADHAVTYSTTFVRKVEFMKKGKWIPSGDVPGFDVSFGRANLMATKSGAKRRVKVTFTVQPDTALNEWAQGSISLKNGRKKITMPVALQPVALKVPASVSGEGTDGSVDVDVTSGTTDDVDLTMNGLAQADSAEGSVDVGGADGYCVPVSADSTVYEVDLDAVDDTADLDLFGIPTDAGCNKAVGTTIEAATGSADESFRIDPSDYDGLGAMFIEVDGYSKGDLGAPMDYRLDVFDVNPDNQFGDVTFDPNPLSVTRGEDTSYTASWTGLDADSHYLGIIGYGDTGLTTDLRVTTPADAASTGSNG